ncbi:MAG: single-stranded DNA-binding protein [Bacteroidota bacterium]
MAGVNKVILVGNLGKDPEIMIYENNVKKATFSLATTESYKNKDGLKVEKTEWHSIIVWRGLAEVAEKYLRKGSSIYLEGKIRSRTWDDQNNVKHYVTEIEGETFTMLGARREGSAQDAPPPQSNSHVSEASSHIDIPLQPAPDDDLPF